MNDDSILGEIEHDVEEFAPRVGGIVDRFRKERAAQEAKNKQAEQDKERIEERSFHAVKTAQESPEVFATSVVNVQAGATAMILPGSPYRFRATLTATATTALTAPLLIAKDSSQALGGIGFPLYAGSPTVAGQNLPLYGRGQLWVFNPAGNPTVSVSVISEIYAPEK